MQSVQITILWPCSNGCCPPIFRFFNATLTICIEIMLYVKKGYHQVATLVSLGINYCKFHLTSSCDGCIWMQISLWRYLFFFLNLHWTPLHYWHVTFFPSLIFNFSFPMYMFELFFVLLCIPSCKLKYLLVLNTKFDIVIWYKYHLFGDSRALIHIQIKVDAPLAPNRGYIMFIKRQKKLNSPEYTIYVLCLT